MKSLVIAAAATIMLTGVGMAQTTTGTSSTPGAAPAGTVPATPAARNNGDTAAASGNSNQTVATTSANAPTPAKGANSFTAGEARSRIEKNGFTNVSELTKDGDGVWHGKAQKSGSPTSVWLDYKGNVGATN
jgi:hypothetical protein